MPDVLALCWPLASKIYGETLLFCPAGRWRRTYLNPDLSETSRQFEFAEILPDVRRTG
jgi:hypothetical protein